MNQEIRAITTEIRAVGDDSESRKVSGLGIVYDKWVELWPGFREKILKGAAKKVDVVKSYFNHDPNNVLSTEESDPPLVLRETEKGIEYESPIPPTTYGKDLEINLTRKNVKGSSFAFSIPKGGDKWWEDDNGVVHREIRKLVYSEIGPVTDPAYVQTSAAVRSARDAVNEYRSRLETLRKKFPGEARADDDTKTWTKDAAADWLKDHDFKTGAYEKMANWHSFRQEDPDKYDDFRVENEPFDFTKKDGVMVIYGIFEEDGERKSEIQSIRFYHGEADKEEQESKAKQEFIELAAIVQRAQRGDPLTEEDCEKIKASIKTLEGVIPSEDRQKPDSDIDGTPEGPQKRLFFMGKRLECAEKLFEGDETR